MSSDNVPNWPDFIHEFEVRPPKGYDQNQYPDWDMPTYKRMARNHARWFFISKAPGMPGKAYRKNSTHHSNREQ